MPRIQSTEAVDCFLKAASHSGLIEGLLYGVLGALVLFVITRAAGAIIGEYAKEVWFKRFKRERERLQLEVERLKVHNQNLADDVEYACKVLAELRGENDRLTLRAIQAEQIWQR